VTPVGIFLPALDDLFLYGITSKVTSDCLVDCLVDWWETVKERFPHIKTLLINLDNGPENHSRRTQFMKRLLEFVQHYQINVRLAYYPPYLSQIQPSRAMLGYFRAALEWFPARFCGRRYPVCQDHDLEGEASSRRVGDNYLSDWCQID
jgi:hypothetical protein